MISNDILCMVAIAAFFSAMIGIVLFCCFNRKIATIKKSCVNLSNDAYTNKEAICQCETSVKRVSDQVQKVQAEIICKKVSDHIKVNNTANGGNVGGNYEQK